MARRLAAAIVGGVIALALLMGASDARAAISPVTYPTAPIKLIVPFGAGGFPDVAARIAAEKLSAELGQPFIVENRPGAGGIVAANAVLKSQADGYTLFVGTNSFWALTPRLFKVPFDVNAFVPVARLLTLDAYLCMLNSIPGQDLKEIAAFLKRNPDKFNYGTPGTGSVGALMIETLKAQMGFQATHIPYKSEPEVLQAMLGGQIQFGFLQVTNARLLAAKNIGRAVAVASPKRSAFMPAVPTLGELGFPDAALPTSLGILAPPGTPRPVIEKLQAALIKVASTPDFANRLRILGAEAAPATAEEFAAEIHNEITVYKKAADLVNLQPQ
jgi:tripartite-type tricarboxylate transporter receptor subunit TctC